jgi:DNA invertase Pin-like site-specific DNA recombinase
MEATTTEKPRAIIYARVSTIRQGEQGHSLDNQERQLIATAEAQGYQVEIFREIASGGRDTRPQLKKALAQLNTGEANALFVASIDRLARSTKHALAIIDQATKHSWRLAVSNIGADTATSQGRFIFQLMAVVAELENNLISDRVKRQHEARRERGITWGLDQGFKGQLEQTTRQLIRDLASLDLSLHEIARELEAREIKTARGLDKWHAQSVKSILNSPQTKVLASSY